MKILSLMFALLLFGLSAFAQDLSSVASAIQGAPSMTVDSFLGQVMQIIGQTKGSVPLGLKISGVTLIIIALLKVSLLQSLWAKMGSFQAIMAPVLGLVLGVSLMSASGPLSLAAILAYMASGAGAIALHEILDMIKGIPGLGAVYVGIIDSIEGVLGGGSQPPAPPAP